MRLHRLTFPNRKGLQLSAKLELPAEGDAQHYALLAHCFTCSKDSTGLVHISRALSARGFGVLRFDFTGLGHSEGEFADSHFAANVEDLLDAAAFLEREYKAPEVLVGHSLGGAAVLFAAPHLPAVRGVVTIAAPSDPDHVLHLFGDRLPALREEGQADIEVAGRTFSVRRDFVEALESRSLDHVLPDLGKALLVFHSPQDQVVGIDHAAKIYQAARHPKSFVSLDGADHLLGRAEDSEYVGAVIATWVRRYIQSPAEEEEAHGDVVVSLAEPGFTCKVKAGPHRLLADEPRSVGGLDQGPAPYDFVSIGLGACTAMTVRMYTDRKEWPLDEIHVHVTHRKEKVPGETDERGREVQRDVFQRKIEIVGELDSEQRARMLEIADRCPVHRTLEASAHIETEALDPSAASEGSTQA